LNKKKPIGKFQPHNAAERMFARALKQVAKLSGHIVETHVDGHTLKNSADMKKALTEYSKRLGPWAARQSAKMLAQVSKKNAVAWKKNAKEMHAALQTNVAKADVGMKAVELMTEQVALIESIPLRAAERAQKLALEAFYNGGRASEIAEELSRSGKVSETDAIRIARTEVARANSVITQARAEAAGSKQYIWRNSGDAAVREAHKKYHGKKLDGMVFSWDSPPTLDDGTTGHPGTFPNCRCYPEPFFPK
jgi:SPP1 gp7 family putative phage head morphogenesis protein